MRSKYLFDFARILGIHGDQVDALNFADFIQYALSLDAYYTALSELRERDG